MFTNSQTTNEFWERSNMLEFVDKLAQPPDNLASSQAGSSAASITMTSFPIGMIFFCSIVALVPNSLAFTISSSPIPSPKQLHSKKLDEKVIDFDTVSSDGGNLNRRHFLLISSTISLFPLVSMANDDQVEFLHKRESQEYADLTSQLFNPDGSLRDPNTVVEAQERAVMLSFPVTSNSDSFTANVSTDGSKPSTSLSESNGSLQIEYRVPSKWSGNASSQLPLYYDSSEGRPSCNRITVYSVTLPKLDMSVLEKASTVGVAKSLFMDKLPNNYFDQGVLKADLISGRTTRKPINSDKNGAVTLDEQVYYEFDLAFAPIECPTFQDGNRENLGLGFCPYDNIFLVSATVVDGDEKAGNMVVSVVESSKAEWKIANSDLKRVRSSFGVNRVLLN